MELLQTTLCYLEKDGAYLMLHRVKKKNDVNHDKWVGVGGKFEPGEDALACALEQWPEDDTHESEKGQADYNSEDSDKRMNVCHFLLDDEAYQVVEL